MNRTTSAPNSVLRYDVDKGQEFNIHHPLTSQINQLLTIYQGVHITYFNDAKIGTSDPPGIGSSFYALDPSATQAPLF